MKNESNSFEKDESIPPKSTILRSLRGIDKMTKVLQINFVQNSFRFVVFSQNTVQINRKLFFHILPLIIT